VRTAAIIMSAVAVLAAAGGYFAARTLSPASPPQSAQGIELPVTAMAENRLEDMVGKRRPDFTLSDASGFSVSVTDFDGQILLVNFWATWCTPCVEEMPMLSDLQERYAPEDVQVVGIALDDAEKAVAFAAQLNIGYIVLTGATDAILVGRQYGNRAGMLPYSVLVDREGLIKWAHLGSLDRSDLEAQIQALH